MVKTDARRQSDPDRVDGAEFARRDTPRLAPKSYLATSVGPVALLVWWTEISVEGVRAIEDVFFQLKRTYGAEPLGFVTVCAPQLALETSSGVRSELARVLKSHGKSIGAATIVYEGKGFKATIVRSVVTAISIASRSEFPYRVFSSLGPALSWLADSVSEVTVDVVTRIQAILRTPPR